MSREFGTLARVGRVGRHLIARSAANVISHRGAGNTGLANDEIQRVARRWGDGGVFYLASCLAVLGLPDELLRGVPMVPHFAYVDDDGEAMSVEVSIDDAPPLARAALRLVTSVAAGDAAMAWAVWSTTPQPDRRLLVRVMADMATGAVRQRRRRL